MALSLRFPLSFYFLFSPFRPGFQEPRRLDLQSSAGRTILARRNPSPCSCSAEASSKKRPSKVAKTDQELCHELLEFKSAMEFPEDRLPTLKELRENGRKDLANILRRRGYKAISELLRLSKKRVRLSCENPGEHEDPRDAHTKEKAEDQETTVDMPSKSISSNDLILEEMTKGHSNGTILADSSTKASESSSVESFQHKSDQFGQIVELAIEGEDNKLFMHLAPKEQNNQTEVDRLKLLLHEKEKELSNLKQQIQKEKIALDNLQAKAKSEIGKVQEVIAEKEVELHAVEECLNGLKEVHVDYFARGQIVEVAGSFNGWQHRVKMNLQHPSALQNSPGARNQFLWSTVLWLYPGVYEIKFIVDGHWRIDPQREIITTGGITNNVLRG